MYNTTELQKLNLVELDATELSEIEGGDPFLRDLGLVVGATAGVVYLVNKNILGLITLL